MNNKTIEGRHNKDFKEPIREGDFCFDDNFTHIYPVMPGSKSPDAIAISKDNSNADRVWHWDGNIEKPTLTPSLLVHGQWHGYLTNGIFTSC